MGNTSSGMSGSPTPDSASARSVIRNPVRILRKSSTNLFKRMDSKSPLALNATETIPRARKQASSNPFVGRMDGSCDVYGESPRDAHVACLSPSASQSEPMISSNVDSIATTVVEDECEQKRPLSASSTIRESSGTENCRKSPVDSFSPHLPISASKPNSRTKESSVPYPSRDSALSPSIPAPSPVPEDTPHKYGLKDRMETPEPCIPEELEVVKARRRSTGLEIFNEAKSLQSASSFLNGLSTSRRRVQSASRSAETSNWTGTSYDQTRPSSARLASYTSSIRRRGDNFKSSGFAYTRPLTISQMKCFTRHARLLPSRNNCAPVECAVCHVDDGGEHFSCTWCALRMCRYCRKDFTNRGIAALRERVRLAELGGGVGATKESNSSPSSSAESLVVRRGRRRSFF